VKLREYIFGFHVGDGRWVGLRGHICGCGDIRAETNSMSWYLDILLVSIRIPGR